MRHSYAVYDRPKLKHFFAKGSVNIRTLHTMTTSHTLKSGYTIGQLHDDIHTFSSRLINCCLPFFSELSSGVNHCANCVGIFNVFFAQSAVHVRSCDSLAWTMCSYSSYKALSLAMLDGILHTIEQLNVTQGLCGRIHVQLLNSDSKEYQRRIFKTEIF